MNQNPPQKKIPFFLKGIVFIQIVGISVLLYLLYWGKNETRRPELGWIPTHQPIAIAEPENTKNIDSTSQKNLEQMFQSIRNQLNLLKNKKIEENYNQYTSKEFKTATSLEQFEQFLKQYPEFEEFQNLRFGDTNLENGLRHVKVYLGIGKEESTLDYWMTPEDGTWKIWGIQVEKSLNYPTIPASEMEPLSQAIKEQLSALHDQDLSKAYYAFASKDFEKSTSFDGFKSFIGDYPIFTEYQSYQILDGVKENNLRLIRVVLEKEGQKYPVNYQFINEKNRWKIWGMQILDNTEENTQTSEDMKEIKETIQGQMEAIRNQDISKAYYAFTSHDFQEETSRDSFAKFIEMNPVIAKNTSSEIVNQNLDENRADITVKISSNKNSKIYHYLLTYEGNRWRVVSIHTDAEPPSSQHSIIEKGVLGTEVDLQGKVVQPSQSFTTDNKNITLNLYIKNAKKSETVSATLYHVESNSHIEPVSVTLSEDGDSVVSFVFSSPAQGWPEGTYHIDTKTSSGAEKTFEFQVKSGK